MLLASLFSAIALLGSSPGPDLTEIASATAKRPVTVSCPGDFKAQVNIYFAAWTQEQRATVYAFAFPISGLITLSPRLCKALLSIRPEPPLSHRDAGEMLHFAHEIAHVKIQSFNESETEREAIHIFGEVASRFGFTRPQIRVLRPHACLSHRYKASLYPEYRASGC